MSYQFTGPPMVGSIDLPAHANKRMVAWCNFVDATAVPAIYNDGNHIWNIDWRVCCPTPSRCLFARVPAATGEPGPIGRLNMPTGFDVTLSGLTIDTTTCKVDSFSGYSSKWFLTKDPNGTHSAPYFEDDPGSATAATTGIDADRISIYFKDIFQYNREVYSSGDCDPANLIQTLEYSLDLSLLISSYWGSGGGPIAGTLSSNEGTPAYYVDATTTSANYVAVTGHDYGAGSFPLLTAGNITIIPQSGYLLDEGEKCKAITLPAEEEE
jgi:hypothetical protein